MSDDLTNVDQVHLASMIVRGVDAHQIAIPTAARVIVAAPFASVKGGAVKVAQVCAAICRYVIQVRGLIALLVWIAVVEYPLVVGVRHIGVVAISGHFFFTYHLYIVGLVLVEIKTITVTGVKSPGKDMLVITPNEVGGFTEWIEYKKICAIRFSGE